MPPNRTFLRPTSPIVLASAVGIFFVVTQWHSHALPPTASLEERMLLHRMGMEGEELERARRLFLQEMPDSPELHELSARLHALRDALAGKPDFRTETMKREYVPKETLLSSPAGRGRTDIKSDLERWYLGTTVESHATERGVFESTSIMENSPVGSNQVLVRFNESIEGNSRIQSHQIGGLTRPVHSRPQLSNAVQARGFIASNPSAGPIITTERLLLEAIEIVHGDTTAGINLAAAHTSKTLTATGMEQYQVSVWIGDLPARRTHVFEFDPRKGGNLVLMESRREHKDTGKLRGLESWTMDYVQLQPGNEWVLARASHAIRQWRVPFGPLEDFMRTDKEFSRIEPLPRRAVAADFRPEWTKPQPEDGMPDVSFEGQIVSDPERAKELRREFVDELFVTTPLAGS